MDELPNAVSYIIIMAVFVSIGSIAFAWGPLSQPTGFAVANSEKKMCTQELCDQYDVKFCDFRTLKQADYNCIEGECRLVSQKSITNCNFACVEKNGPAHCEIRSL